MIVRRATEADGETLRLLWQEFVDELDQPDWWRDSWEERWAKMEGYIRGEVALLAEVGGRAVGYALARMRRPRVGYVSDLFVREEARRRGVAKLLMAEALQVLRERGADVLILSVDVDNRVARTVYQRLGFRDESLVLVAEAEQLAARLDRSEAGASFGSIHVQSDDVPAVERAVREYVPRLPGGSQGSVVAPPRNGWIAVHDELCDREPELLRRLARELSDRIGAVVLTLGVEEGQVVRYILFEGGRVVDEYLSAPEYHGPLPPGDVVALSANPTVVARLTGADPARLREVARTVSSPAELPAAPELLAGLAEVLGVHGAEHGYAEALDVSGAMTIPRG